MYSMGAPRIWVDLRSWKCTVITCVDPSYSSGVVCHAHRAINHSLFWCVVAHTFFFLIK